MKAYGRNVTSTYVPSTTAAKSKSCFSKKQFDAKRRAKQCALTHKRDFYRCSVCGFWHLTSAR